MTEPWSFPRSLSRVMWRPIGTPRIVSCSRAEVGLQEHAHRVAFARNGDDSRCRAVTALEVIADHAGAAAHAAKLDRPAARAIECGDGVLGCHVKAVDVVEVAVIGLGRDRQAPGLPGADGTGDEPADGRVAGDTAGMSVGDGDRRLQLAGFLDPCDARHLSIAVQRVVRRPHRARPPSPFRAAVPP